MKKKSIVLGLSILAMTFCLAGCSGGSKKDHDPNKVYVDFRANYFGAEDVEEVELDPGAVMNPEDLPVLTRDGYEFAGWYTVKHPKLNDEGYYDDEWIFGKKFLDYGAPNPVEGEITEMAIDEDITLYAHWEKPTYIKTAEDLKDVNKNLYGYYVLANDIDLSGEGTWTPIGVYEAPYEYTNPQWWVHGFRGTFDGDGHTIKGLQLDGSVNGSALIAAAGQATIKNVNISDYTIKAKTEIGLYAAPLLGFGLGNDMTIENCHTDGSIDVTVENKDSDVVYSAITGLAAGDWGGKIDNCSAKGTMKVKYHVPNGSEINIGGINGEGYTRTINCTVNMDITAEAVSDAKPVNGEDTHADIYIGMIQGAATVVEDCKASGKLTVGYTKPSGEVNVNVGGIVGQERFDTCRNNISQVVINVLDGRNVYAAGMTGSYNTGTYGMIGALSGIKDNNIEDSVFAGLINISNDYTRENLMVGYATTKLPDGTENPLVGAILGNDNLPKYKIANVSALKSDAVNVSEDGVTLYDTIDDMADLIK